MADKIRLENYEPSDSEDEYSPQEKRLLEKVRKRRYEESGSDEEVYRFSGSGSDDEVSPDIVDSDVEGKEASDDDLPDPKAWGKNKRVYHSTDYVDKGYDGFANEEVATMEEREARVIQKRLAEQLGDEDFSLDFFTSKKNDRGSEEERKVLIKSDLSQMSKRQKLQLLERESPEFLGLIDDFKNKLSMAKDNLKPVLNLIKEGKIPNCSASQFVKTNFDLILNYCTNISFYLLLKAKKVNIQNHPVVKKLYQYRQMLNQMEPVYEEVIKPQIDSILAAIEKEVELQHKTDDTAKTKSKKRKIERMIEKTNKKLKSFTSLEGSSKDDRHDTGVSDNEDEYEGEDYFSGAEGRAEKVPGAEPEQSEESGFSDNDDEEKNEPESSSNDLLLTEEGEKRQITYQMAKNKGLTPHRKKEQRNPRVKHRMKYKKAKVRRKGAVREVRREINRYAGEVSGIKANVKKGIKIKS